MAVDTERVAALIRELLVAIGEDPERPGLRETPGRVAQAAAELYGGIGQDPAAPLAHTIDVSQGPAPETVPTGSVLVRDIRFRSMCEHHLLPFSGVAHVAYLPDERIVGLGRLPAVVATIAARPQIQERLSEEVADALEAGLEPHGVLVVIDASHGCVASRGSRQVNSSTVTMASRGVLADPLRRAEIMALIGERSVR